MCTYRTCYSLLGCLLQLRLQEAAEIKEEGNDSFRGQQWNDALVAYRRALARLPKRPVADSSASRKGKARESDDPLDTSEGDVVNEQLKDAPDEMPHAEPPEQQTQCSKARAILNANIAACYVKLVSTIEASLRAHLTAQDFGRMSTRRLWQRVPKVNNALVILVSKMLSSNSFAG
jgi:hypothetical protein